MLRMYQRSAKTLLATNACTPAAPPVWLDLIEPSGEEVKEVEQGIGIVLPTRAEMEEIELSARLYREDDAVFMTMTALAANVEGFDKLWKASDMGSLLADDAHSLADSAGFDLHAAHSALTKMDQPTAERLADGKYLDKLDFVGFNLKDAVARIDGDVASAIGLGAGFSFADGD